MGGCVCNFFLQKPPIASVAVIGGGSQKIAKLPLPDKIVFGGGLFAKVCSSLPINSSPSHSISFLQTNNFHLSNSLNKFLTQQQKSNSITLSSTHLQTSSLSYKTHFQALQNRRISLKLPHLIFNPRSKIRLPHFLSLHLITTLKLSTQLGRLR